MITTTHLPNSAERAWLAAREAAAITLFAELSGLTCQDSTEAEDARRRYDEAIGTAVRARRAAGVI